MPAITSIDEFLELVRRSGAIDPRRLDGFVAAKYGGQPPDDPQQIADDLVASNLLTRYHTEPILAGRPQRFVLSGKYRIIDRLGAGGMASVFLCEHKVMRRRVAIKMLPPSVASNPAALDRFHREARAMAGVHHPNIVGAHDVDQDGKIHFIVMEYVDGTNFHELIRRAGPLPLERAAHYIAHAAKGLQHAHDKGLVHRDIKPANLLLDRFGTVKILDLGLALVFHADDDNLTKDHDANSILGTAEYLAPEQAVDSHAVDHRADIYSLGMTLYFLLAAQTPFGEGTTAQKLIWHQLRQPKPIRDHRPDLPEELWTVLSKMLAKDVNDRFQNMQDVAEALSPWTGKSIPLPSDNEMPKPLDDLQPDFPMADSSAATGAYTSANANPGLSLPTPFDAGPATGGRSSKSSDKDRSNGVAFALPGGLEAAIPTPPIASAPTAPSRAAPSTGGGVASRPAVTPSPVRPVVASAASPSGGAAFKASPASSAGGGVKKTPAPSSGSQKNVLVSTVEDDEDDDSLKSKPKSKKHKKKGSDDANKGNKGVLIAVGAGGVAALVIGGIVLAMSGGSDVPTIPTSAPPPPSTRTDTNNKQGGGTVIPPPSRPTLPSGALANASPDLMNVAGRGKVTSTLPGRNNREGVENLIDAKTDTKYHVGAVSGIEIKFEFVDGRAYEVRQYGFATANDQQPRDPKSWDLHGSNDDITWDLLDRRSNIDFGPPRRASYVWNIDRPKPYKFYRLSNMTNNGAKDTTQLAEWTLYAPSSAPNGVSPSDTPPVAPPTGTGPGSKPFVISDKIEAEVAQHTNVRVGNSNNASGGRKVVAIDKPDSEVTFRVTAEKEGPYQLVVHYTNGKTDNNRAGVAATQRVTVNGSPAGVVNYKPTTNWDTYDDATLDIKLKAGENVIKLTRDTSNVDLDYAQVTPPPPPSITLDYFPTTSRVMFYDVVTNIPQYAARGTTGANPWSFTRQSWTYVEKSRPDDRRANRPLADITVSLVLLAAAATDKATPTLKPPTQSQMSTAGYQVKIENDMLHIAQAVGRGAQPVWEPILKVGAKEGESWDRRLPNGEKQTYKLTNFGEYEGKPTVTVKTDLSSTVPAVGRGGQPQQIIQHTTYTFAKDIGEIERTIEWEIQSGTAKGTTQSLSMKYKQ